MCSQGTAERVIDLSQTVGGWLGSAPAAVDTILPSMICIGHSVTFSRTLVSGDEQHAVCNTMVLE